MTNEEIAAKKTRVIVLFGIAVAAFVASYVVPGDDSTGSLIGVGFVCIGVLCLFIGGKIAMTLKTETPAK